MPLSSWWLARRSVLLLIACPLFPCCPCSAAPDPPTIDEVVVEANCTEGVDVLTVYLTPPANKGSGKTVQFAETGKIVKYIVTAEPESGPTITVAGEGEVEDDGSVRAHTAPADLQCRSLRMCRLYSLRPPWLAGPA